MRFLVTGGAGFIGSHLVDRIIAEGHSVTILDNFASGKRENIAGALATGKARLVEGSILKRVDIDAALERVQCVFHLAVECVRLSIGQPLSNHEINATGALNVLEASRARGVERFVYCSSSEVYGNASSGPLCEDTTVCAPTTVYGAAKLVGELYTLAYLRTYGLPAVVVRPFNAFGPREHDEGVLAEVIPRFLIRILNGEAPVIFGDGSQGRDFTYVADTARALWQAAHSDRAVGATINIGWGRMIRVGEIADNLIRLTGRNDLKAEHGPERPGDIHSLIANTFKAKEMLGFVPEVEFAEGLRRYVDWFCEKRDVSRLSRQPVQNWTLPAREVRPPGGGVLAGR